MTRSRLIVLILIAVVVLGLIVATGILFAEGLMAGWYTLAVLIGFVCGLVFER